MPPLSVLTLALLGGFIFVTQWYPTKYFTLRSESYRLVFAASIAGAVFLLFASDAVFHLSSTSLGTWAAQIWLQYVPLQHSGKATLAFLIGALLWFPLNLLGNPFRFLSDGAAVDRAIRSKQDPLEVLLRRALGSKTMLSVTLKSGKVYIGRLHVTYNPAFPLESISLLLSYSGHRDKDTQTMTIDIDYEETHKRSRERIEQRFNEEIRKAMSQRPHASNEQILAIARARVSNEVKILNYEIVIRMSEIQSINVFDEDIYSRYFDSKEPH